ncbi:flagellar assembly peptidoglycan hydrolase FlgJ [Cellvibrio sp.]|uniref:flagellar assembly peptidoglycan hydrolase FlgJ n=1 Tax=Cellvibrio sp. TaxID=1965322 RepID=UPI0039648628
MTAIDKTSMTNALAGTSLAGGASAIKDNFFDQNSLNSVKAMGRHNDPAALKEIAKKFEAMFVQQMLKSMREANAVFSDGDMFSSEEVKFHQDMMDQQMVLNLTSGEGIGLAKAMFEQMQKSYGKPVDIKGQSEPVKTLEKSFRSSVTPIKPLSSVSKDPRIGNKTAIAATPEDFVEKLKPYAEKAAAELNVGADVILAQAALETGWGKYLIHDTQGNNTFNIFNIKATSWNGKSVSVNTLENKQGVTQQERAAFRQYDDYADSFADYVSLIKNNPRYKEALAAGGDSENFADALQKAGYATDPNYADKIKRILNSDSIRSVTDTSALSNNGEAQS